MKIRYKVLITSSIIILSAILLVCIIASDLLFSGFRDIEDSHMHQEIYTVQGILVNDIDSLDLTCRDYATWDSTYNYVLGENDNYTIADINPGVLSRLNLHAIAIMKNDGTILFVRTVKDGLEKDLGQQDELYTFLQQNSADLIQKRVDSSRKGIIQVPSGVGIFSSRPILKSSGEGPVYATLIFIELLDTRWIDSMNSRAYMNISSYQYDSAVPEDVKLASVELAQDDIAVNELSNQVIAGYLLLTDIRGNPSLILKVSENRDLYIIGKDALIYMLIAVIVTGIVLDLLFVGIVEKIFIKRLTGIKAQLDAISHDKMVGPRLECSGNDELSSFAKSMNDALASVERVTEEKQHLFNLNPDTFIMVSPSAKITDYKLNEPFGNVKIGLGTPLSDVFTDDVLERVVAAALESEGKDVPVSTEFPMYSNGLKRHIEARIISTKDKGYVMILRDITDRKNIEVELLVKNTELEKFNRFATDRELRMIAIKKENSGLKMENDLLKKENESLKSACDHQDPDKQVQK